MDKSKYAMGNSGDAMGKSKYAMTVSGDAMGNSGDAMNSFWDAMGNSKDAMNDYEYAVEVWKKNQHRISENTRLMLFNTYSISKTRQNNYVEAYLA